MVSLSTQEQRLKETGQSTMFDLWGDSVPVPFSELELTGGDAPSAEKLAWERELLGVYVSEHPFYRASQDPRLVEQVTIWCGQVDETKGGQRVMLAGCVTTVRTSFTRQRRAFLSVVLEDLNGSEEITVWPELYERTQEIWKVGNILLVQGRVRVRGERVQLDAEMVKEYDPLASMEELEESMMQTDAPEQKKRGNIRLHITVQDTGDEDADVARLGQIFEVLGQFPGSDLVRLSVVAGSRVTRLVPPHEEVGFCPDLQQRLEAIVGEDGVRLEQVL
jgi:DNA polymerase-3 subunit alpha